MGDPTASYVMPTARGCPLRSAVRVARLRTDGDALEFVDGAGNVQRYPVASGSQGDSSAIVDALWCDWPQLARDFPDVVVPPNEAGGVVILRNAAGRPVARIPLDSWLPEAEDIRRGGGLTSSAGGQWSPLATSGVGPLLSSIGVPCRRVSSGRDEGLVVFSPTYSAVPSLDPIRTSILWAIVVRMVPLTLAAVAILAAAATHDAARRWLAVAAGAVLAAALFDQALLLLAFVRDRRFAAGAVIWRPRPSVPVTRQFIRHAQVRLADEAIIVRDQRGVERWLPRQGPNAVVAAVLVAGTSGSNDLQLRSGDGRTRASLPLASWLAADETADLARRCGLSQPMMERLRRDDVTCLDGQAPARYPEATSVAWVVEMHHPVGAFSALAAILALAGGQPWWVSAMAVTAFLLTTGRMIIRDLVRRWWWGRQVPPVGRA